MYVCVLYCCSNSKSNEYTQETILEVNYVFLNRLFHCAHEGCFYHSTTSPSLEIFPSLKVISFSFWINVQS